MKKYIEQIVWTVALLALFLMEPTKTNLSFCIFKLLGFASCFGCGLGHAIHFTLHGEFQQSVREHILGIPATIGLIYTILKPLLFNYNPTYLSWTNNK
jgi:hypothetical protein